MEREEQVTPSEVRLRTASAQVYLTMFVNDIACGTVVRMVDAVRKGMPMRQELRYDIGRVDEARRLYERRIAARVHRYRDSWMEMCDMYTEGLSADLGILGHTLRNCYLKTDERRPYVYAAVMEARVMLEFAVRCHAVNVEGGARYVFGRKELFTLIRLDGLRNRAELFAEKHCPHIDDVQDGQVQLAIDVLGRKMNDPKRIVDAINAAAEAGEWHIL